MLSMSQSKQTDKYNCFQSLEMEAGDKSITTKEMIKKVGCLCFIDILFILTLNIGWFLYNSHYNIDETISQICLVRRYIDCLTFPLALGLGFVSFVLLSMAANLILLLIHVRLKESRKLCLKHAELPQGACGVEPVNVFWFLDQR